MTEIIQNDTQKSENGKKKSSYGEYFHRTLMHMSETLSRKCMTKNYEK